MGLIALKVDVDTLRGTREGVPRLLRQLDRAGVRATFLFSLGPDHTGRALRRAFRRGFMAKAARTSVLSHYGLRTLLYGVLIPGPDIGRVAAGDMRAVARSGHECGIHCWDHVLWQDKVRLKGEDWTVGQMQRAYDRFGDVFGQPPATHGAAGWQMNAAAFRQIDRWQLRYASDCRAAAPFMPVVEGQALRHVQLPTSLPTLDELIGLQGIDSRGVAARLLASTDEDHDHVYTLHAELEGGRLAGVFDALVHGWQRQGHRLGTLGDAYRAVGDAAPRLSGIRWTTVPGRSGELVGAEGDATPDRAGTATGAGRVRS